MGIYIYTHTHTNTRIHTAYVRVRARVCGHTSECKLRVTGRIFGELQNVLKSSRIVQKFLEYTRIFQYLLEHSRIIQTVLEASRYSTACGKSQNPLGYIIILQNTLCNVLHSSIVMQYLGYLYRLFCKCNNSRMIEQISIIQ